MQLFKNKFKNKLLLNSSFLIITIIFANIPLYIDFGTPINYVFIYSLNI